MWKDQNWIIAVCGKFADYTKGKWSKYTHCFLCEIGLPLILNTRKPVYE